MMTTKPLGIYVHVPYCVRKCNYCDFCSRAIGASVVEDRYIDRLISEIGAYSEYGRLTVDSIYFGGGTPSLLSAHQLERVVSALHLTFDFEENVEFTLEANPGTVDEANLRDFRSLGVNRLSLGVQSANEDELLSLGRIHTHDDFIRSFSTARKCGFDNVSVDLMYGIPNMTRASLRRTLDTVLCLRPEHISLYGLIIEEGTPFFEMRDSLPLPSVDEECDMYYDAAALLSLHGYSHYEISNYARPGYESRHNLKYWRLLEYIGFGASAASYFGGRRYVNTRSTEEYISDTRLKYETVEIPSAEDTAYEYVMLGLRLREGISLDYYRRRFGRDFLDGRRRTVDRLVADGLAELSSERFALTERGFYVSNSVLTEIL